MIRFRSTLLSIIVVGLLVADVASATALVSPVDESGIDGAEGVDTTVRFPTPETPARQAQLDQTTTVAEIRAELTAERTRLEALEDRLVEQQRLYDQLATLENEQAALISDVEERVALKRDAYEDLTDLFYPYQDTPERFKDLSYELKRTNQTLADLQATIAQERLIVGRLRESVQTDNQSIAALETPLAAGTETQWESQLEGLSYLDTSLAEQEADLLYARVRIVRWQLLVNRYEDVWRDTEKIVRLRVLAQIEDELDDAQVRARIRESRFESQGYVVSLLIEHHRARMETVAEYRTVLDSLERDLGALDDPPTRAGIDRLQSKLGTQRTAFERVQGLLETESPVASELRNQLGQFEEGMDARQQSINRQIDLYNKLSEASTAEEQQRLVERLSDEIDRERNVLLALRASVDTQRDVVGDLYAVGQGEGRTDQRVAAYLRVRDRVADLLDAILESEASVLETELVDLDTKDRAVGRLRYATGVQDLWDQLVDVREEVRSTRLESNLLENRTIDQRRAFDLLSDLRTEANATFASEVALLDAVSGALDRVEPVSNPSNQNQNSSMTNQPGSSQPTTVDQSTSPVDTETTAPDNWATLFTLLVLFGAAVLTILWLTNPNWKWPF